MRSKTAIHLLFFFSHSLRRIEKQMAHQLSNQSMVVHAFCSALLYIGTHAQSQPKNKYSFYSRFLSIPSWVRLFLHTEKTIRVLVQRSARDQAMMHHYYTGWNRDRENENDNNNNNNLLGDSPEIFWFINFIMYTWVHEEGKQRDRTHRRLASHVHNCIKTEQRSIGEDDRVRTR